MEKYNFELPKPDDQNESPEALRHDALEKNKQNEGYLLIERLRSRSPESIESFDINEDGLATHGSDLDHLESILLNGFDFSAQFGLKERIKPIDVYYNLVGSPATDNDGRATKIGFGPDRIKFGGQIVFVTDIFKQLWPNVIHGMTNLTSRHGVNAIGGEIEISHRSRYSSYADDKELRINFYGIGSETDWKDLEEYPEPRTLLIPEFEKEKRRTISTMQYQDGQRVGNKEIKSFDVKDRDLVDNQKAFRQLLSPRTFNAIVITDRRLSTKQKRGDVPPTQEEVLARIVDTQNKLLPKNEQIPVYNERGECLYNPLRELAP